MIEAQKSCKKTESQKFRHLQKRFEPKNPAKNIWTPKNTYKNRQKSCNKRLNPA